MGAVLTGDALNGKLRRLVRFLQAAAPSGRGVFLADDLRRACGLSTALKFAPRYLAGVGIYPKGNGQYEVAFAPNSLWNPTYTTKPGDPSPAPAPMPLPDPSPKIDETPTDGKRIKVDGNLMPSVFEDIVCMAKSRKNILLVGPAGCGKTFIAEMVAKHLGLRFGTVSVSAGVSESALIGRLLPTGAAGKYEYTGAEFVDFFENGGVFLIDEADAGDPNTLLILNQGLANGRLPIPVRMGKPYAKRHKDTIIIAAANTWGHGADRQYVGRQQLDAAFMDRFRAGQTAMDYDREVEQKLLRPEVFSWGWSVRNKVRALGLRRVVSTRVLLDFTDMVRDGRSFANCKRSFFADWKQDEVAQVDADYAAANK